jgi:hypothetical protein
MRAITYYQHNAATGKCKLSLDFRAQRPQWKAMRFGMLAANHLPPPDEASSSNPEGDNVHPCCSIQFLPHTERKLLLSFANAERQLGQSPFA